MLPTKTTPPTQPPAFSRMVLALALTCDRRPDVPVATKSSRQSNGSDQGRDDQGRDGRQGARSSLGSRVSARRRDAGHREARHASPRGEGRHCLEAALRRAEGRCHGAGRAARRCARSRVFIEPPRLSHLFRARRARSLDRGGAWQARRERPRRCRGDLPPGAEGSRAAIISARVSPLPPTAPCSSRSASASSSIRRRTSPATSARSCASIPTGRSRRTIPSSARRMRVPKSGLTDIAIRKAPPFIPRPASCGRPNSVRGAGTSSTFPRPGPTMAGRW